VLDPNSPLHRLPAGLHRRQKLMLDGIATSIDMATMSYARLQNSLLAFSRGIAQGQPQSTALGALVMMDAWMIIDAVNRLRALVEATRGLKRGPAVISFYRSVEDVETLRNAVQHLPGEVAELEKNGRPLWGSLSWHYRESPDAKTGDILLLVPGTIAPTEGLPMVSPWGKEVEIPIGLVELTAAEMTVCLSSVAHAVERFAERLERAAATAFAALPGDAVDQFVTLDLPVDSGSPPATATGT
jgi:hypothetical protein